MYRCSFVFTVFLVIAFAVAMTGCLGNSTSVTANGGVKSIALNPTGIISLDIGSTQVFTASAVAANGRAIPGVNIQYVVSSPAGTSTPPPLSFTSAGDACAGTWDSAQAICRPGNSGIAVVTAVANGVQSAQTTVYVHEHVDNLQITDLQTTATPSSCYLQGPCCSQGQTWIYQGIAYNNGVDITTTVGPMVWATTNSGVITTDTDPSVQPPLLMNQVQITGASPGVTNLYASVSGTTSNVLPLMTCLVASVRMQIQGSSAGTISVDNGTAVALQATAVDTLGNIVSKPPLTWSTSNPESVSFSTLTNSTGTNTATARSNLGGSAVTASCSPPSCNIGILPGVTVPSPPATPGGPTGPGAPDPTAMPIYVFASDGLVSSLNPLPGYGAISIDVISNSSPPTYTGYAATNQCGDTTNGCTSVMFAITPNTTGANPIGVNVVLPRTPNSMMFNHQSRVYFGSYQGLMYVDVGGSAPTASMVSSASTPCNVALCGTVLAISNDGKQVVVSDNTVPTAPQIYIYNTSTSTATTTDLVLPSNAVVTAASFSPDQSKIFILTQGETMYVYSTVNAFNYVSAVASGTDVAFSADGSFAYVAGGAGSSGTVAPFSTCAITDSPSIQLASGVTTLGPVLQIFPSPTVQHLTQSGVEVISQNVYVLEPPNLQVVTAEFTQSGIGQFTCNPPNMVSFSVNPTPYNLGQGNFTPVYARLVGNGSEIIIVARFIPAVLVFNVANGTTSSVPLKNSFDPIAASASTDGSQVYVAACDQYPDNNATLPCTSGSVHVINTSNGSDLQVPYINDTTNNMCTGLGAGAPVCFPTMVAIKPQ